MDTTVINKPSALHVKSVEDIMYLLKESEERWWRMSIDESYKKNMQKLSYIFNKK